MANDTPATPTHHDGGNPASRNPSGIEGSKGGPASNARAARSPGGTGPDAPRPVPEYAKRGPKPKKHGPIADARREAQARYIERKSAGRPAGETVSAPRGPAKETSPGYAKQLVKLHDEFAEILDMPVIRIEQKQAHDLEQAVMVVMADRGVVLRSETAHIWALVGCVVAIYLPILLALARRFLFAAKAQTEGPGTPNPAPRPQSAKPTPGGQAGPIRTVNGHGMPESNIQIFPDGARASGNLFMHPGTDLESFS